MINQIIPLIASFLPMWRYVLVYVMCAAFIAAVPCIIRYILRW